MGTDDIHQAKTAESAQPRICSTVTRPLWAGGLGTEAVSLSNLRGSKVQVLNRLGWLVQIVLAPARQK